MSSAPLSNAPSVSIDYHQLSILLVCLVCMGSALGFERSLLPRMAVEVWGIQSSTTVLNLVSTFGASKAIANIVAGPLADYFGRRPTLMLGFLVGLPVMPYVNIAESWTGVTVMNVAFGVSQGLLGSALFFLLIDVLGPQRRGIAVGLGECTIYVTTAVVNVLAGSLASRYGFRPVPFWVATVFGMIGLISTGPLRDTLDQVQAEQSQQQITDLDDSGGSNKGALKCKNGAIIGSENIGLGKGQQASRKYLSIKKASSETNISIGIEDLESKGAQSDQNRQHTTPAKECKDDKVVTLENIAMEGLPIENESPSKHLLKGLTVETNSSDELEQTPPVTKWYEQHEWYELSSDSDSGSEVDWDEVERENKVEQSQSLRFNPANQKNGVRTTMSESNIRKKMTGGFKSPTSVQEKIPAVGLKRNRLEKKSHAMALRKIKTSSSDDIVDECTPLAKAWHESYESGSDSELDPEEEVDWDEVEKDVKTLYPSALQVLWQIFRTNRNFNILCIAGMAMNFKDGFAWGAFPIFFSKFHHVSDQHTGMLVAVYPLCWGFAQAFTGALSDVYGRKLFLVSGFSTCTFANLLYFIPGAVWGRPANNSPIHFLVWIIADVCLGFGTAMAYPALQAAVADEIPPVNRGLGLGFYRFARDMGYVVGALVCGHLTDLIGYPGTFLIVSGIMGVTLLGLCLFYSPKGAR